MQMYRCEPKGSNVYAISAGEDDTQFFRGTIYTEAVITKRLGPKERWEQHFTLVGEIEDSLIVTAPEFP